MYALFCSFGLENVDNVAQRLSATVRLCDCYRVSHTRTDTRNFIKTFALRLGPDIKDKQERRRDREYLGLKAREIFGKNLH